MATVYFVKHGLDEYRGVPGRYPFVVAASALQRSSSSTYIPVPFSGTIYADALVNSQFAGNVDPHVFSDILPWFHSYCLIDKRNQKRLLPSGRLLPESATAGDVVIYGSPLSKHIVFVDTILSVSRVAVLPQSRRSFCLEQGFRSFCASAGLSTGLSWPAFTATASYRLNFADSMPGRRHHRAHIDPHYILIGTRDTVDRSIKGGALLERFLSGTGFNFIPLARSQSSKNKSVAARPELFVTRYQAASSILGSGVNELSAADGHRLLQSIFDSADRLVLDPLRVLGPQFDLNPAQGEP